MPYGNEEAYEEMDPMQKEAKVSALKDLISMMQDLIVKAGGDPGESEGMMEDMPMSEDAEVGESALADVMGASETDLGMGNGGEMDDVKEFMKKGSKLKPKGQSMTVALSVSKGKGKPMADKGSSKDKKGKKSKMKRYG